MTNDKKRLIGTFVTISGLILSVVSVQPEVTKLVGAPAWLFDALLVIGLATAISGALLILMPMLTKPFLNVRYELELAKESDLKAVHVLAKDEIGDSVITLKSLREWHHTNPTVLWVFRRYAHSLIFRKNRIVGFFSVVPITKDAAEKLFKNREGAFHVTVESIVPAGTPPAAWYVSALAAKGDYIRGRTVEQLFAYASAKAGEATLFLAAPTTEDGLRVAQNNGFVPTDSATPPLETIFYREFGDLSFKPGREKAKSTIAIGDAA